MPYFIYQIQDGRRVYLDAFNTYPEARDQVRQLRAQQAEQPSPHDNPDNIQFRLIYADSQEEAETLLGTKREAPILKEWEK